MSQWAFINKLSIIYPILIKIKVKHQSFFSNVLYENRSGLILSNDNMFAQSNAVSVRTSLITQAGRKGQPQATVHKLLELQAHGKRRGTCGHIRIPGKKLFLFIYFYLCTKVQWQF